MGGSYAMLLKIKRLFSPQLVSPQLVSRLHRPSILYASKDMST